MPKREYFDILLNCFFLRRTDLYNSTTATGNSTYDMHSRRSWHTVTTLPNGKVLVTGGDDTHGSMNTAELFNPFTQTWNTTKSMHYIRAWHRASVLRNGKVLITGGNYGWCLWFK